MPTSINFSDNIFAQAALKAFVAECAPLSAFSHSYNAESKEKGANVYVPRVEAIVATTFTYAPGSGLPYQQDGGTINTITVTMDQHFITTVGATDLQNANSSAGLVQLAENQGKALAVKVWQKLATAFVTANYGVSVANLPIASFSRATSVSVRTIMAKRDVNPKLLSMIINQDVMNSFLADSTIYQAYSFGESVARDGAISKLAGMKIFDTNILPGNGISLVGVVAHPDSLAVANRYLEPQGAEAYLSVMRVVDEPSQIVIGYRRHVAVGEGKMYVSLESLFGFSVGLSLGAGLMLRSD